MKIIQAAMVCLFLMIPGQWVIAKYGLDWLTALPLFWGGMIYLAYLQRTFTND
jgi:hypothetical protein